MKKVVLFENHAILSFVHIVTAAVAVICTLPLQALLHLTKGVVEASRKAICLEADILPPDLLLCAWSKSDARCVGVLILGSLSYLYGNSRHLPKLFTFTPPKRVIINCTLSFCDINIMLNTSWMTKLKSCKRLPVIADISGFATKSSVTPWLHRSVSGAPLCGIPPECSC